MLSCAVAASGGSKPNARAQLSTAHFATSLEMARFCSSLSASRAQISLIGRSSLTAQLLDHAHAQAAHQHKNFAPEFAAIILEQPLATRSGEASSGSPCLATISIRTSRGVVLMSIIKAGRLNHLKLSAKQRQVNEKLLTVPIH